MVEVPLSLSVVVLLAGQHSAGVNHVPAQQQRPIMGSGGCGEVYDDRLTGAAPYCARVLPPGASASSLLMHSIMSPGESHSCDVPR